MLSGLYFLLDSKKMNHHLRQQENSCEGGASAAKKQKTGNCKGEEQRQERDDGTIFKQEQPVPIQSFSSTEQRVWRSIHMSGAALFGESRVGSEPCTRSEFEDSVTNKLKITRPQLTDSDSQRRNRLLAAAISCRQS